jgi:hypothetical protein
VALKDLMPRWLRRLVNLNPNVGAMHDAIEATFAEIGVDLAAVDADTVMATASVDGLTRWGFDLSEPQVAGQTSAQYASTLQAIKQGQAVNQDGLAYALGYWGLPYTLLDAGDPAGYGDYAFGDWAYEVKLSAPPQVMVAFADPFGGATPTPAQLATSKQALASALKYANRVKARGVQLVAWIPLSLR